MIKRTFPQLNDEMFFIDREVIISKIYKTFQLAQVHYLYSSTRFIVDINTLSIKPDNKSSISIKTLGGVKE